MLIPNFTAYSSLTGYADDSPETLAVCDQLYYDMKTNIYNGTSFGNFITGLQTYVGRYGRSLSFTNVASSGTINYDAFQLAIAQQRPVALFLSDYNIIEDFYESSTVDEFFVNKYSGNHVVVAYGYKGINYYRTETYSVWSPVWYNPFRYVTVTSEVNFRSDTYLKVSSGIMGTGENYMRLNQSGETIDYAASIFIN
jgi:hypothetical protein